VKTFLAVVGALALLFLLAIVALVLWFWWKVRRITRQVTDAMEGLVGDAATQSTVPPFRITLVPVPAVEWEDPDKVEDFTAPLRAAQFVDAGTFVVAPTNLRLAAFCLPQERAYAAICEHPLAGCWMELVSYYEDGSSVTYSTLRDTLLDRAEHKVIRFFEGFGAEELLRTFLRERPRKPLRQVSSQQLREDFERAYAEGMDWIIARGGPTEEEIRRHCDRSGRPCTPAVVQAIRGRWTTAIDLFRQSEAVDRKIADRSE
jgi:hypothetical protein